jgi:hypothetical protein
MSTRRAGITSPVAITVRRWEASPRDGAAGWKRPEIVSLASGVGVGTGVGLGLAAALALAEGDEEPDPLGEHPTARTTTAASSWARRTMREAYLGARPTMRSIRVAAVAERDPAAVQAMFDRLACPTATAWLRAGSDIGLAPRTIEAYARGLSSYIHACQQHGIDPLVAGKGAVAAWLGELKGLANATPPGARLRRDSERKRRPRSGLSPLR